MIKRNALYVNNKGKYPYFGLMQHLVFITKGKINFSELERLNK